MLGVICTLCCLLGFPYRILVVLSLQGCAYGSCPFSLLRWRLSGHGVFFSVMSHYDLFESFVYVVYVDYDGQSVAVRGVLTLYYELQAPPSSVSVVFNQLSLRVSCVFNGSYDVRFVVL